MRDEGPGGSDRPARAAARGCLNCGGSLAGYRADALHCSGSCRRQWNRRQEGAEAHGQEVLARAPAGAALAAAEGQART